MLKDFSRSLFSLGLAPKTRSFSRETATAMFFDEINTLLSPFHGFTFNSNIFPRLKPGATCCRLYEAKSQVRLEARDRRQEENVHVAVLV